MKLFFVYLQYENHFFNSCPFPEYRPFTTIIFCLQITKRYEEKQGGQGNDLSLGLLDGLIGQLQIQAPQAP
jgi:hypothetical protein